MLASVVAASIVIRLGLIEALLRFYYLAGEDPRPRRQRPAFAALFWTTTVGAAIALALAEPISEALLDRSGRRARPARGPRPLDADPVGVRADAAAPRRARPRLLRAHRAQRARDDPGDGRASSSSRTRAPPGSCSARFGTGAVFLAGLLWQRAPPARAASPSRPLLRRMIRFGLPTMPAELSLYSLNFIDRILIVRLAGLAEAGLYALAIKFAQGINVLARGFQLAFPPLAYSIADDDEARRAYSLIVTWFAAVCAFVRRRAVAALALDRRPARGAGVLRGLRGDRPARHRDLALRALPRPGRDPRPHRPHRVQPPGDRRGHRRQHRPQPGPDPAARDRRRRRSRWSPPTSWCSC